MKSVKKSSKTTLPKRDAIKELFFNEPTKHWHFEDILKKGDLSRAQTNHWLREMLKEGLIRRVKPRGKMPHFIACWESPHYTNAKKLFALEQFYQCGFLDRLASLPCKTVILFGSMARGDWYTESDIDLFVYQEKGNASLGQYLSALKREVQIFSAEDKEDLQRLGGPLLRNILKGIVIQGNIPQEVYHYAAI